MAGAKMVNNHLCAWNKDLLMIADSNMTVRFNGVVSGQMESIDDVEPKGSTEFMVIGKVSGIPDTVYGGQRITSNYVASTLRAR